MDDSTFIFLKQWADDLAWGITHDSGDLNHSNDKKIVSIILESMSPSKEWKKKTLLYFFTMKINGHKCAICQHESTESSEFRDDYGVELCLQCFGRKRRMARYG